MKTLLSFILGLAVMNAAAQSPILRGPLTTNTPSASSNMVRSITSLLTNVTVMGIGGPALRLGEDPSVAGVIPTLSGSIGVTDPLLYLVTGTNDSGRNSLMFASFTGEGIYDGLSPQIVFVSAGGTAAAPNENWVGSQGQILAMAYVGGSVGGWSRSTSYEFGMNGANPTGLQGVLGKHQFTVADGHGTDNFRGVVVMAHQDQYADDFRAGVHLTDGLNFSIYRIGFSNTLNTIGLNTEQIKAGWTNTTAFFGTEKQGTGASRNLQLEIGNTPVAELSDTAGVTLNKDRFLMLSDTTATRGTAFSTTGNRLLRAADGRLIVDNTGTGGGVSLLQTNAATTTSNLSSVYIHRSGAVAASGAARQNSALTISNSAASSGGANLENIGLTIAVSGADVNTGLWIPSANGISLGPNLSPNNAITFYSSSTASRQFLFNRSEIGLAQTDGTYFAQTADGTFQFNNQEAAGKFSFLVADVGQMVINSAGVFVPLTVTATNSFYSLSSNRLALTSITIGASPVNWTNTLTKNVYVFVDGVSVTGTVAINDSTIFNTIGQCTVPLQPGEWTTIAFTIGTPTAKWKPF